MPHKLLFIESGQGSGGSFENLYQLVQAMDRTLFIPIIVFVNHNKYVSLLEGLGVQCHLVTDWMLSLTQPRTLRVLLWAVAGRLFPLSPRLHVAYLKWCHGRLLRQLKGIVAREKVSLIYLNDQIAQDFFGAFLARDMALPCVSHLQSTSSDNFDSLKAELANAYVTSFITPSRHARDHWAGLGIDPSRIHVIPNAVPQEKVVPLDVRQQWNIPAAASPLVGFVGRLAEEKGLFFLLETFALLKQEFPNAALVIVGEGAGKSSAKALADRLKIQNDVVFTGYQSRAREIMAGLDMLVLPSQRESFGRVLIEAMSCGTPVVGADIDGIREVVEHGINGLLVPYGDHEALARAISKLASNHELRRTLVENGLAAVMERYSMDAYVQAVETVMLDTFHGLKDTPKEMES